MSRHLLWLLLALSLLFNIFFAAGYVKARAEAKGTDRDELTRARIEEMLDLDQSQAAAFARLRSEMREDAENLDDAIALASHDLLAELSRQSPDLDRVRQIVARKAELHEQRRRAGVQRFNEFLSVLSPEQCRRLSRGVHARPPGRRMQHRIMEMFDADGDGQLDDGERAEAEQFIEAKRQERERRRQALRERFDLDGDGRLDEAEEAALREWMRRRGPSGRGGPRGGGPGGGGPGGGGPAGGVRPGNGGEPAPPGGPVRPPGPGGPDASDAPAADAPDPGRAVIG
jgi:hypothetical protein